MGISSNAVQRKAQGRNHRNHRHADAGQPGTAGQVGMMQVVLRPKPCCDGMKRAFGDVIHFDSNFGVYFSSTGDPDEYDYPRLEYCPWCGERIEYVEGE